MIRPAFFVASIFAIYLCLAMLVPAAVDLYFGNDRMPLVEIALARAGGMRLVMPGEHGR